MLKKTYDREILELHGVNTVRDGRNDQGKSHCVRAVWVARVARAS